MIFKNAELYNVGELIPAVGGGYHMCRVTAAVREKMTDHGKDVAICPAGVEIRFVLNSGTAKITLRSNFRRKAVVCYGALHRGAVPDVDYYGPESTTVEIGQFSDPERVHRLHEMCGYGYSPDVIRVILEPFGHDVLVDIEGDVRPPRADEVPEKRVLVYGSSITHGSFSMAHNNSYVYQIGRKLGYDAYNLGFGGSCMLEKEMADYISENGTDKTERSWDLAVMELGVNTLDAMDHEEFGRRAKYLLDVMCQKNPDKKIFVTDIYTHLGEIGDDGFNNARREALRRQLDGHNNVIFIPGTDFLTDFTGLSADGIHPNVDGMLEIANTWCRIIKENL